MLYQNKLLTLITQEKKGWQVLQKKVNKSSYDLFTPCSINKTRNQQTKLTKIEEKKEEV